MFEAQLQVSLVKLNIYKDSLNERLKADDFYFQFNEDCINSGDAKINKLTLSHPIVKDRTIDLFAIQEDGAIVVYLNYLYVTSVFSDFLGVDNMLKSVYKKIKAVLQNKLVTLAFSNEQLQDIVTQEIELPEPIDEIKTDVYTYREKEKKYLTRKDFFFGNWSGHLSENQKCYLVGMMLTKHPELTEVFMDISQNKTYGQNAEKILWKGKNSRMGHFFNLIAYYIVFLIIATPLCCFGFFGGLKVFLILECICVAAMFACSPINIKFSKKNRFIVTNMRVIMIDSDVKMTWFKDIEGTKFNKSEIKLKFKRKIKGALSEICYFTDMQTANRLINENIERIDSILSRQMQKFETPELQGQYLKAFSILQDVVNTWNPYKALAFASPCMEFGLEIAQIAEYLMTNPSKDALVAFMVKTYSEFFGFSSTMFLKSAWFAAEMILTRFSDQSTHFCGREELKNLSKK